MKHIPSTDHLNWIEKGLPPAATPFRPKKVIIVGAGMAGLVAADMLSRAGHDPLILEAQSRIGGRVYTLREPFAPGLYGEAGAMRIPRSHELTMAYIEKFALPTYDFTLSNPHAYCRLHGQQWRMSEVEANPMLMHFDLRSQECDRSPSRLWEEALAQIAAKLEAGGEGAWEEIAAENDQYSVREFLEANGWSEGAIERFGLLSNQEAMMNSSFMELLREEIGGFYTNLVQLVGGSDRLPHAFLPALQNRIRFGAKMVALDQSPLDVTIYYQTAGGRFQVSGDYAVLDFGSRLTIPGSVKLLPILPSPTSKAKSIH